MNTLYHWMAAILAGCWAVTHNYALAIALLTIAVVAVTTPLTWKSTRGMLAMQMLAPEIKKLQQKYKGDKEALNREMMALYKENNINPLGGCLPLLPQMLVFFVLYRTIYNISHRATFTTQAAAQKYCSATVPGSAVSKTTGTKPWGCADPQNISHGSSLYHNLIASGGHMKVWGFDLTLGVRTAHGSAQVGYWILVVLVVGAYYIQTRQMSSRNPAAAAANPQMQSMQKIFPIFFGFISITIQAGVNIYFLVSALCRIGQQSLMYRHDPMLRRHVENAKLNATIDVASREKAGPKKGFFASLMTPPPQPPAKKPSSTPPRGGGRTGGNGASGGGGRAGGGAGGGGGAGAGGASTQGSATGPPRAAPDGGQDAAAPKGTLARLWAVASGANPPPSAGGAPSRGGTGPTGSPTPGPTGEEPDPGSTGAADTGGTSAATSPGGQANGAGSRQPPGARSGGRNGARSSGNGAPRPPQKNRSRGKRARRPR